MTLPMTPTDITAEWLNDAVGGSNSAVTAGRSIVDVAVTDIGDGTGIFGEIARLSLTLEDGSSTSLVAKMPCTEPANLHVAQMLGIYEREMHMFEQVLDRSPMHAPACRLVERGPDGQFVLLLDDMSTNWTVGDQIVGATIPQAEQVVDALAEFHVHWWESPELDRMEWLPKPNAPQYTAVVPGLYRAGLEGLQSDWADKVPPQSVDVALALAPRFEDIHERTAGGPTTLIHTDTRLDNIFFAADGSGKVAFIDFQLALAGRGVADIAYMVGTSVPHADAAQHWEALLRRWHGRIVDQGIDYAFDDALTAYREAALYYLSGAMALIGTFDTGNERGAAWAEAYTTRMFNHVVDIDAVSVL
ncbi:phosphotransferase [Candidatus Poriferisodalis sp.]|uniref:phosphotransferase n=1 Tax=Candidatus Poriferisodalis sp. TaxID=3101277 RepID=UPI003B01EFB5